MAAGLHRRRLGAPRVAAAIVADDNEVGRVAVVGGVAAGRAGAAKAREVGIEEADE